MNTPKILVVDDDDRVRELVRHFLVQARFEVAEAADGLDALKALETQGADLAVVDVMMPRLDGWELCVRIKRRWKIPVLLLTAKAETSQKLKGFDLGSDDYLVKPFDPLELVARVKVLLKHYKIEAEHRVAVGTLVLDSQDFAVQTPAGPVTLPRKEFDLLFKLASNPGRTFSRDQLLDAVWGQDFFGTDKTLDVHMNRLRGRFPDAGFRLKAIRGLGYRLEVEDRGAAP